MSYTGMNYDFFDSPTSSSGVGSLPPTRPIIPLGPVGVTSTSASFERCLVGGRREQPLSRRVREPSEFNRHGNE